MDRVGIKTLRNRLSQYVHVAASGQTVLVTDRGRVVAELIAPRVRDDDSVQDQRLGELIRAGLISPAKAGPGARLPRRRPVTTLADVLQSLDESREDR